jgi:hypothetical protein
LYNHSFVGLSRVVSVECWARKPDCCSTRMLFIVEDFCNNRNYRNWSIVSAVIFIPCLKTGVTLANFQSSGNIIVWRDKLKMLAIGSAVLIKLVTWFLHFYGCIIICGL